MGTFWQAEKMLEEAFLTSFKIPESETSFISTCDVFRTNKILLIVFFSSITFSPSASLRSELNHIHASAIEHLRQTHQQESAAAKIELEKTLENNRIQVGHQFIMEASGPSVGMNINQKCTAAHMKSLSKLL